MSHAAPAWPWPSRRSGSLSGERLVQVVEQRRALHQRSVHRRRPGPRRARRGSRRSPPPPRMWLRERGGCVEVEQDAGRGGPGGDRHAADRSKAWRMPSGIAGRRGRSHATRWSSASPVVARRAAAGSCVPGRRSADGRRPAARAAAGWRPAPPRDPARHGQQRHRHPGSGDAQLPDGRGGSPSGRRSAPTRRSRPSVETVTLPSRSVRRTRAPAVASRASVDGAGCPYGLPVPGAGDRDPRPERGQERVGGGGAAAVMGHLEQVGAPAVRDARGQQLRVDVVLDVAHQQEPAAAVAQVEHDRRVVDGAAVPGRPLRARCRARGHQVSTGRPSRRSGSPAASRAISRSIGPQPLAERRIPGSVAQHPVLRDRGPRGSDP